MDKYIIAFSEIGINQGGVTFPRGPREPQWCDVMIFLPDVVNLIGVVMGNFLYGCHQQLIEVWLDVAISPSQRELRENWRMVVLGGLNVGIMMMMVVVMAIMVMMAMMAMMTLIVLVGQYGG